MKTNKIQKRGTWIALVIVMSFMLGLRCGPTFTPPSEEPTRYMYLEYDCQLNYDLFILDSDINKPTYDKLVNAIAEANTEVDLWKDNTSLTDEEIDWSDLGPVYHWNNYTYVTDPTSEYNMHLLGIQDAINRPYGYEDAAGMTQGGGSPHGFSYVFVEFIWEDCGLDHPNWPANSIYFYKVCDKVMIHELGHLRGGLAEEGEVALPSDCVMAHGILTDYYTDDLIEGDYLSKFCFTCIETLKDITW